MLTESVANQKPSWYKNNLSASVHFAYDYPALCRQGDMPSLDTIVKERLERAKEFIRALQERFGAWLLDKISMLVRIAWYLTSFTVFIFITTLCPYFAWASIGESFYRNPPILYFQYLGLLIMAVPVFVLIAHLILTIPVLLKSRAPNALREDGLLAERNPSDENLGVWPRIEAFGRALRDRFFAVLRFFYGERTGRTAYYVFFFGGAILITLAMLITSWGNPLSITLFGKLNVMIMSRIASIPGWIISNVADLLGGITFEFNTDVLKRVLGLSDFNISWETVFWSVWVIVLFVVILVATGSIGPVAKWKRVLVIVSGVAALAGLLWIRARVSTGAFALN